MTKASVAFVACLVVSVLLLYLGIKFYAGVVAQHVPGYPNRGQFYSCLLLPGGLVALNMILAGFAGRMRWPYVALTVSTQCIAFLAFVVLVGAGI